jgi:hypothetical protein
VASAQQLLSGTENMTLGGDDNQCDSDEDDMVSIIYNIILLVFKMISE